jgi:lipopolysaccharide transport system ATP-binding protein
MSSSEIAIRVSNLSKCYQIYDSPSDRFKQFVLPRLQRFLRPPKQYYSEFWALKNLSFEVKKGETVGIIGRNGSGKSTLLQMICGTLNPTSGSVQTNGRIAALLELGSGFNPEFTGRENVYMNASVLGLEKIEIDARFDDIAAFADIGEFIEQPVKTYSSGMMMRLAFAVAINVNPSILIVDEALSVGDEAFQRKCFARIEHIKKTGGTILFVTHATQTVVELCDHALLLRNGELVYLGQPNQAVAMYYRTINQQGNDSVESIISADTKKIAAINQRLQGSADNFIDGAEFALNEQKCLAEEELAYSYDASLVSQTRHEIHNRQYGVNISNITLQNTTSDRINILDVNHFYSVAFDVEFAKYAHNISYQVLFKTVNGIPVAGDRFLHEQALGELPIAGVKQRIRYIFECSINPGVYFISIEACGDQGALNVVYHKFAEVLAFRVRSKGRNGAIGYASMKPKIESEVL